MNRILIDYPRNAEGATAAAPYTVPARANAPVATPIDWKELTRDVRFDHFNLRNLPQRGGWYVIRGEAEVGTVVAFVSGLNNVRDPWGELVNWCQDMMVTRTKYGTFVAAMERFAKGESPLALA